MDWKILKLQWGDVFVLNLNRAVDRQIYLHRFEPMETQVIRILVGEGETCVDVGANIGYYTALMARCSGANGRVVAFEPGVQIRPWLKVNLDINGYSEKVTVLDNAVSNAEGEVTFYECVDAAYSSTIEGAIDYEPESRRYEVSAVKLDDALSSLELIDQVGLIKIDCVFR